MDVWEELVASILLVEEYGNKKQVWSRQQEEFNNCMLAAPGCPLSLIISLP
jgi:hypothetical protein